VWDEISRRGPTDLVIVQGIMDADFYVSEILDKTLLPFLSAKYPDGHRL
jgi:hypothetical protein